MDLKALKQEMSAVGVTQISVAKEIGIGRDRICRFFSGKNLSSPALEAQVVSICQRKIAEQKELIKKYQNGPATASN